MKTETAVTRKPLGQCRRKDAGIKQKRRLQKRIVPQSKERQGPRVNVGQEELYT